MMGIEETIPQIERLYRTLTGKDAPPATETPFAAIPPEKNPAKHIEEQMDRLLGALAQTPIAPQMFRPWCPPLTVLERTNELCLELEVAGVPRTAIELKVAQNVLLVSGRRPGPETNGAGEVQIRMTERPMGFFQRQIALPPGSLCDQMTATLKDGVLEIRVPRAESAPPGTRTITVQ
jgi:HSP20 family protein